MMQNIKYLSIFYARKCVSHGVIFFFLCCIHNFLKEMYILLYLYRLGADEATMVKEFSRPAAGRADTEPSNLRPAPVLKKTLTYLYEK